jgi:hypothetical protein
LQESEVILLALDGAFSTRACVLVSLPQVTVSWDERVKAIVLLWIGVDDAPIGRIGTIVGKVGARGKRRGFLGSGQGATPLNAQAIIAEARSFHWETGDAYGDIIFETQRASISQVVLVAFIERDDEGHTPTSSSQTEVPEGIVSSIQGSGPDGESKGLASVVESGEGVDGIVTVAVGDGNHQGELAAMLEGVRGEFVEAVAVDPALTVAVPAPESKRIAIGTQAGATLLWFLVPIVTGTEFFAVGIGPGGEFAAITGDVETGKVDQAQLEGTSDKAGKENGLEKAFKRTESRQVAIAFEGSGQG